MKRALALIALAACHESPPPPVEPNWPAPRYCGDTADPWTVSGISRPWVCSLSAAATAQGGTWNAGAVSWTCISNSRAYACMVYPYPSSPVSGTGCVMSCMPL